MVCGRSWKMEVRICLIASSMLSTTRSMSSTAGRVARGDGGPLEGHAGREELLDDMVVQVAGDAGAVLEQLHPLRVSAAVCKFEGDRGVVGERGGHVDVGGAEGVSTPGASDHEHPSDSLGAGQGQDHDWADDDDLAEHEGSRVLIDVGCVFDDGRLTGLENHLAQRVLDRVGGPGEPVGLEADRDGDLKSSVLREDYRDDVRIGELGDALSDETKPVIAGGGEQLPGDVGRCLEPCLSPVRLLVEARVLDRDTGGGGQC